MRDQSVKEKKKKKRHTGEHEETACLATDNNANHVRSSCASGESNTYLGKWGDGGTREGGACGRLLQVDRRDKKATYLFDAQCCVRCQLCHPQDAGSHVCHDLAMAMLFQCLGMQRRAAWEDRGCWEGERSTRIRKKSEVKKMKEKKKGPCTMTT